MLAKTMYVNLLRLISALRWCPHGFASEVRYHPVPCVRTFLRLEVAPCATPSYNAPGCDLSL